MSLLRVWWQQEFPLPLCPLLPQAGAWLSLGQGVPGFYVVLRGRAPCGIITWHGARALLLTLTGAAAFLLFPSWGKLRHRAMGC